MLNQTYSTGVGALVSPLISTQFVRLEHWNYYYLASLGISIIVRSDSHRVHLISTNRSQTTQNVSLLVSFFRLRSEESLLGNHPNETETLEDGSSREVTLQDVLKLKMVHMFSLFTCVPILCCAASFIKPYKVCCLAKVTLCGH